MGLITTNTICGIETVGGVHCQASLTRRGLGLCGCLRGPEAHGYLQIIAPRFRSKSTQDYALSTTRFAFCSTA
jgi:hypothetical protein